MGARLGMGTLPFSFAQDTHLTMNAFITLFACIASASAAPQFGGVYHPRVHGVAGYPFAAAGAYAGAPIPAPYNPSSAFAAQDEFGNTQYGYSNLNSQKHEVGNTYTGVQGSYSYVDANGIVQTTNYIADGLGFRVQATNLPVAPVAPVVEPLVAPVHVYELPVAPVHEYVLPVAPVYTGVAPIAPLDTPGVAAAKAAHLPLLAAAEAPAAVEVEAPVEVEAEAPVEVEAEAPVAVEAEAVVEAEAPAAVEVEAPAAVEAVVEEEAPAAVEPVVEAEEVEAVVERRRRQTPANTEVLEAAAPLALPAIAAPLGYAGVPAGLAYGGAYGAYGAVGAVGAYGAGAYPGAYAYPGVGAYPYAAPAVAEVVRSAPAAAEAELHTVKLNPGHATAYR